MIFMRFHEISWNLMTFVKFHGIPWNFMIFMKFHEIPWSPMDSHGISLVRCPVDLAAELVRIAGPLRPLPRFLHASPGAAWRGSPRISWNRMANMRFHGIPWNPMVSMEIHEIPWNPMDFMKVHGIPWVSWNFMKWWNFTILGPFREMCNLVSKNRPLASPRSK